jgi:Uncharacterised nucleotidyltransferase
MREAFLKLAILSVLKPKPDLAPIEVLRNCDRTRTKRLLLWLDQSGLAFHFLDRLQREKALDLVSADLRQALEQRAHQNRVRMHAMLSEFSNLNKSFTNHGVRYSAMKGFTLVPEYCPDPFLRHQTDFDFLIAPESAKDASRALVSCGYELQESGDSGEMTFGTPLLYVPSRHDNIYDVPRHRQVDLHTALWHEAHCVSIGAPIDCLNRLRRKSLLGVSFPALAEDDMFLLHVFHIFQHLLASWIRLSWLFELDHFLGIHEQDAALWHSVLDRASGDVKLRRALGLVLRLTNQIFPRHLPPILEERFLVPLPRSPETWVRQFGVIWAISDLPGNKLTLFVHRDFVNDQDLWRKYLRSRIFPMHLQSSLSLGAHLSLKVRARARVGRYVYALGRVISHVREMARLALGTIRWRRALRSVP